MKKNMFLMLVISGVLLFVAPPAQANTITVDFTTTNFNPIFGYGWGTDPPPTNPVSGTIVYDAASLTANVNSLLSIDLTIDGHTYGLSEIGFLSPFGPGVMIGGVVSGINSINFGTNDFFLGWDQSNLSPHWSFIYSSLSSSSSIWETYTFSQFSVTESAPVPDPSTMILLGSGLVGLVGYGRRRFKK